jgi:hypothetical protein
MDFPVDFSPYSLRHTATELMMLAGVGYDLVAERMGHATPATTFQHYRNISGPGHRDAADRIEAFFSGAPARSQIDPVATRVATQSPSAGLRKMEKPLDCKGS